APNYTIADGPANGSASINGESGLWSYTPDGDFYGSDSFTVSVTDDAGNIETQQISLSINPDADAGSFTGDTSGTGSEDGGSITGTLIFSDSADGDTAPNYTIADGPANGSASINGESGLWSYTPDGDFYGSDSFTVSVIDDAGNTETQLISLSITTVNDLPLLTLQSTTTFTEDAAGNEVGSVVATFSTSDADGDSVTVTLDDTTNYSLGTGENTGQVLLTAAGLALVNDGSNLPPFTLTPNDGSTNGQPVSVDPSVSTVNDAPVASADTLAATEDTPVTYTAADLLGNDTDGDANTTLTIATVTSGTGGTAVLNGNGTVTFTPTANFTGAASFTYTVSDGTETSNAATVTVNVTPVNDTPVAVNDTLAATEDTPVTYTGSDLLGNDTDGDGNTLTLASVTSGTGGTAVLNGNGTVTFTPTANFNGTANFTYTVSDGMETSNAATVTVNVAPVNDPPVAVDDTFTVAQDATTSSLDFLANDTDPDGNILSITSIADTRLTGIQQQIAVTNGVVNVSATGEITFTPNSGYTGSVSFDYTASDGHGGSASATVNGTVTTVATQPIEVVEVKIDIESFSVSEESTFEIKSVNQAEVLLDASGAPSAFALELLVDGELVEVRIPIPTLEELDIAVSSDSEDESASTEIVLLGAPVAFTLDIEKDENGGLMDADTDSPGTQLKVIIELPEQPGLEGLERDVVVFAKHLPWAAFQAAKARYGVLTVLTDGKRKMLTDVDGKALTIANASVTSVTSGAGGTAVLKDDGTVLFTPDADFTGEASFTYAASYGTVISNVAGAVTVNVATDNAAVAYTSAQLLVSDDDPGKVGLQGLDGKLIISEKVGSGVWFKFMRQQDGDGKYVGNGAVVVEGLDGKLSLHLYLTDNELGDNDLVAGSASDPGLFYKLVAPESPSGDGQPGGQTGSQPGSQPVTQPVAQPGNQPVTQPSSQPVTQSSGQPVAQSGVFELASVGSTDSTFASSVAAPGETVTLETTAAEEAGAVKAASGETAASVVATADSSAASGLDAGSGSTKPDSSLVLAYAKRAFDDLITWATSSGLISLPADGQGAAAGNGNGTRSTTTDESRTLAFVSQALGIEPGLASGMLEALALGGASLYAINRFGGGRLSSWVRKLLPAAPQVAAATAERIVVVFKLLSPAGLQCLVAARVDADKLEILAEQALPMSLSAAAAPSQADLEPHLRKLVERVSNQTGTHDLPLYDPHLRQELPIYDSLGRMQAELQPQGLDGIIASLGPDQLVELRSWINRPSGTDLRQHPVGDRLERRQRELRQRMNTDKASLISLLELSLALGQRFA
ncbi:tandem-95 repeat protein, partial [Cyanobium sp. BA20m-p-22]